jgi:hypothetical protein
MSTPEDPAATPAEGQAADELAHMPYEPLLPVERKLIAGSLLLGAVLLAVLIWVSYTFFPAQ